MNAAEHTHPGSSQHADGGCWSVAKVRCLALSGFSQRTGVRMSYEDETAEERVTRRKRKWTPTEIRFKL